jgi:hypothetical protein
MKGKNGHLIQKASTDAKNSASQFACQASDIHLEMSGSQFNLE